MFPNSTLVIDVLHENNSQPTLKNVLQITIYNKGSKPFNYAGIPFATGESFVAEYCGAKFEFDIAKLKFDGSTTAENHAIVMYNQLHELTPQNC